MLAGTSITFSLTYLPPKRRAGGNTCTHFFRFIWFELKFKMFLCFLSLGCQNFESSCKYEYLHLFKTQGAISNYLNFVVLVYLNWFINVNKNKFRSFIYLFPYMYLPAFLRKFYVKYKIFMI